MTTRPDTVGRCWSLMRIALRSSFVHLEASLCQVKVRTHALCCLVACIPFIPSPQSLHGSGASLFLVIRDSMAASVIDTRGEFRLGPLSGEGEQSGHSGSSSLMLGASWSVGDVNWMPRHSLLTQS